MKTIIRKTRHQGTATVMTLTGFLELDKFYEVTKEGSVVIIKEVEIKLRSDTKTPVEAQKVT